MPLLHLLVIWAALMFAGNLPAGAQPSVKLTFEVLRPAPVEPLLAVVRRRLATYAETYSGAWLKAAVVAPAGASRFTVSLPAHPSDPRAIVPLIVRPGKLAFHRPHPRVPSLWLPTSLTGKHLSGVRIIRDSAGWSLALDFNSVGTQLLTQLTEELVGKQLAICLDDHILIAPTIMLPIPEGKVHITFDYTLHQAQILWAMLQTGELPGRVRFVASEPEP